jgi:hypothetical protein
VPYRLSGLAATCALALAAGVLATAPPAGAAAGIAIVKVQYDAAGYPDSSANSSVNGEYVVLRNAGTTTRCLTKWTLRDVAGHVYTFGSYCLAPGATAYVHSGKGTNTATNLFWGSGTSGTTPATPRTCARRSGPSTPAGGRRAATGT